MVTNALFEELGMPPYPHYIARHLPANFLIPPSEQGPAASASVQPVPIEPISAEPTPAHMPEPEESTVEIIEWDDPMKPIGFLRSASEPVEVHPASLFMTIGLLATLQQIVASRPALTMKNEQRPAPTSLNEHRPALTDGLTEQNTAVPVHRAPIEPLPTTPLMVRTGGGKRCDC